MDIRRSLVFDPPPHLEADGGGDRSLVPCWISARFALVAVGSLRVAKGSTRYVSRTALKSNVLKLISLDLSQCAWINGHCHKILLRRKAIKEVVHWLETEIKEDIDYYNDTNVKQEIVNLFTKLWRVLIEDSDEENDIDFLEFAESHLLYNDASEEHLPIPVYSYSRPDMGAQFLLHI